MLLTDLTNNLVVSDNVRDFNVDSDIFGGGTSSSGRIWLLVKVILILVVIIILSVILAVIVVIFIVIFLISVVEVVFADVIFVGLIRICILIGSRRWRGWGSCAAFIRVWVGTLRLRVLFLLVLLFLRVF